MKKYESMLTTVGKAKLMAAQAKGEHVQLTTFAVGSGIQATVETQKALQKEEWRGAITNIAIDSKDKNVLDVETVIPANEGGFHIREFGVFDEAGDLIIVGNTPESYKPLLDAGAASSMRIISKTIISNAANVTLLMDENALYVTHEHLQTAMQEQKRLIDTDLSHILSRLTKNDDEHVLIFRALQRLMVGGELNEKVEGGYKFFDQLDEATPKNMQMLDETHQITTAVTKGATTLPISGFAIGQEVSIFDDVNAEDTVIAAVDSNKITIKALRNSYKRGAVVTRSTLLLDRQKQVFSAQNYTTYSVSGEVM